MCGARARVASGRRHGQTCSRRAQPRTRCFSERHLDTGSQTRALGNALKAPRSSTTRCRCVWGLEALYQDSDDFRKPPDYEQRGLLWPSKVRHGLAPDPRQRPGRHRGTAKVSHGGGRRPFAEGAGVWLPPRAMAWRALPMSPRCRLAPRYLSGGTCPGDPGGTCPLPSQTLQQPVGSGGGSLWEG